MKTNVLKEIIIIAFFCCASLALNATAQNATSDAVSITGIVKKMNKNFKTELQHFTRDYVKSLQVLQCMSTAINQRKKYVKNYRSQYDKNCPFSTLRKTGKGKTSIEACTAGFVAAVVLKSVEFLEKAVNCIPKSVILEHDYKACDSYVKKLEDAISLVKKDKPEKFHCTVGVLSRFSFIANEAKNDIMKCGALVSFHPVYCLGRIQKRIDQDYKNSYRQLERCIARTDVLPKNNAHSRN